MDILLGLLTLPLYVLLLWPLVAAARRVLGVRIGAVRALCAAAFGWLVAGGIGRAFPGSLLHHGGAAIGLLIPLAGSAFLATLIFLFVAEMALPHGIGLGRLRGRLARTRRYAQISRIAVKHGLGRYLTGRREPGETRHAKLARSLRRALEEGGVTFVKLGQLLSTRADLLPPMFADELGRLQDQVAPARADTVRALLADELGGSPDDVFAEFDPEPLAAASVAQVYRAKLRSGEDVVVKVQRPGVREQAERDIAIVRRVAAALEDRADWARSLGVAELADGFAAALAEELDFTIEARNITAVAATGSPDVVLPKVHKGLSTDRVLVMSRLDGKPLTAAKDLPAAERRRLARSLLRCLLDQVMLGGVFHADPHPGNLMLLGDGRLGLLDFGSVGRLDAGLRGGLQNLLLALDRGDPAGLRDGLLEIVDRTTEIDEQRLERALGALVARHFGPGRTPDLDLFTGLFRVVADFRLSVPPPVAAVFRALATVEGTLAALDPGFDVVAESRAFAVEQVGAGMRPGPLGRTATGELLALLPVLRRIPRRIDRIGAALEEGRLSVNVRLFSDERDRDVVTSLVHEALLAFVGAATGLMAVFLLTGSGGPRIAEDLTLHQVFGYNLLVISALVGLRLLFVVFRRSGRASRPAR
ncbi:MULTISPECIES: AarF/UbiB family protein [unclassified Amycolatopsis]|uniref:ABC1 kinase family protein n=1 Tax=unclassified Amycolatopsis TaxID=2618356 RepID=UPI0028768496|nr:MULTISPECIES: AarF/UbiB family protein [unclassified Amycolatopsis]MDS0138678.1 AarF/ABC1/UbiB kinase family protein [Amycolatopsis sp. 505]MDS0146045.1 AarF/ABC1/UbiB kinase family protein [Amycolatopsis sp. CM201R]